jgi:hypothetical protein
VWKIIERLFLGDYASGKSALEGELHPTDPEGELRPFAGVVSLCPMPLLPGDEVDEPIDALTEWLRIPILDGGNGEEEFAAAVALSLPFIRRRRLHGNVLVHCAAGMSRSVSVIAATLCEEGETFDDVFDRIARAKADAISRAKADLSGAAVDPELLIAPAWEFRTCLERLYGSRRKRAGSRQ